MLVCSFYTKKRFEQEKGNTRFSLNDIFEVNRTDVEGSITFLDIFELLHQFCSINEEFSDDTEKQKVFSVSKDSIQMFSTDTYRAMSFVVESGNYGVEAVMIDRKTRQATHRRSADEAAVMKFNCIAYVPKDMGDIQIEDIFHWFFETYLKEEFHTEGFIYTPPSPATTYFEKCKLLASAIDGVLKQYRLFCEDGQIDRELLEISSGHIIFQDVPSTVPNKYGYACSPMLQREMELLFSDQSMMAYTEKTKSKYHTLPQLLMAEDMKKEDFKYYQQGNLDWLIERGSIQIDADGYLRINRTRTAVLGDLFYNEVVCPNHYDKNLHDQGDTLFAAGDMYYESTLFSKPEQDYLNYVLNRSKFTNGLDLRNKYIHDTCPLDKETQAGDYIELLKIMVLTIIKINEEFCLGNP